MKKQLILCVLVLLLSLLLVGCVAKKVTPENEIPEIKEEQTEAEAPAPQETETEEKEEPAPVPKDKSLDTMTDAEKAELNAFVSKFAETFIYEYASDDANRGIAMYKFALLHSPIHKNGEGIVFTEYNYDIGIREETMNAILDEYFGQTLSGEMDGPIWYENGTYWTTNGGDVSHAYFCIVTDLFKRADGTYEAWFDKFYDPANENAKALPAWYSYSKDEASANCEYQNNGIAIVREKTYNGKQTYELVSYRERR